MVSDQELMSVCVCAYIREECVWGRWMTISGALKGKARRCCHVFV